ncbi:MAG TPA: hypothetical protein VD835_09315 [Pyrinomonadaceae bacterium]|nr:hypothetical protein [Pyrinomonadaceae bacterium]
MREIGEDEVLREYLLGRLNPARRQELEEKLLSDGELAGKLEAAQDALIDDYAFNTLSKAECESLERHFLMTPERLNKLRISQALDDYVRRHPRPARRPSWWRNLLRPFSPGGLKVAVPVAVLALCVVALSLWFFDWSRLRGDSGLSRSRQNIQASVTRVNREPPPGGTTRMATLLLSPGLERGGGDSSRRAIIAPETQLLQLDLEVPPGKFIHYTIRLTTEEGAEIFTYGGLRLQSEGGRSAINVRIPTEYLPTGDYRAIVTGSAADGTTGEIGRYPFQIVNRAVSP